MVDLEGIAKQLIGMIEEIDTAEPGDMKAYEAYNWIRTSLLQALNATERQLFQEEMALDPEGEGYQAAVRRVRTALYVAHNANDA